MDKTLAARYDFAEDMYEREAPGITRAEICTFKKVNFYGKCDDYKKRFKAAPPPSLWPLLWHRCEWGQHDTYLDITEEPEKDG